jgi:hypothetical protein
MSHNRDEVHLFSAEYSGDKFAAYRNVAHVLYKDHTIVYSSREIKINKERRHFIPLAVIAWMDFTTGKSPVHSLRFRAGYTSAEEARAVALNDAKYWVEHRLE